MCQFRAPSGNHCSHILPSLIPALPHSRLLGSSKLSLAQAIFPPGKLCLSSCKSSPRECQAGVTLSHLSGTQCLSLPLTPPHLPLHSLTAATLLLSGCFEWGVLGARRALDGSCLHRGSLEAALRTAYDILSHILPASWGSVHPPSTSCTQCLQKHPVGQRGRQGLWCPRSVIPVPVAGPFSLGTREAAFKYHPGAHLQ